MNLTESELSDLRDELLTAGECLADPELHRGPAGAESAEERAAREDVAREVCQSCPVAATCLTYALHTLPTRGMWAGFTSEQIHGLAELLSTPVPDGRERPQLDEVACLLTASEQIAPATAAKVMRAFTTGRGDQKAA